MASVKKDIFLSSETTGTITGTITQATGAATLYSREILEDSEATDDKVLLVAAADDDTSTPTIQVKIRLYINGSWTTYVEIEAASAVAKQILVSSYDQTWWRKNNGVQFEFTKAGAGAVTYTKGSWI